ncbi:porin [Candidatus Pelagibacter sp.]|nr:porin [Candidatus Pelagibacter sp.]
MNNLKKLGLAVAGSTLVASSAYAGALDVSGNAKISMKSADDDEVTGNSFSMDKGIAFTGSGELDNGYSVSYLYKMSDSSHTSSKVSIDMGDAGVFGVGRGNSGAGIRTVRYALPTAGEEVWDDVDTDDNGIVGTGDTNALYYSNSFGGVGFSGSYHKDDDTEKSFALTYSGLVDGLTVGYGNGEKGSTQDQMTMFVKYTMGGLTAAYQVAELDNSGATADEDATGMAVSFAVNESLSVSYGIWDVDMGTGTDEESSGVSASYTSGGMTVGIVSNATDNVAGAAGEDTFKEVSVSFAF